MFFDLYQAVIDPIIAMQVVGVVPWRSAILGCTSAGHFGQKEDGRNIRPGPNEVRAIAEHHAEHLVELLLAADQK